MLELRLDLYGGVYIYRDGEYFDTLSFMSRDGSVIIGGSGIEYSNDYINTDSVLRR